jgi:hypothetical protein
LISTTLPVIATRRQSARSLGRGAGARIRRPQIRARPSARARSASRVCRANARRACAFWSNRSARLACGFAWEQARESRRVRRLLSRTGASAAGDCLGDRGRGGGCRHRTTARPQLRSRGPRRRRNRDLVWRSHDVGAALRDERSRNRTGSAAPSRVPRRDRRRDVDGYASTPEAVMSMSQPLRPGRSADVVMAYRVEQAACPRQKPGRRPNAA